jgi:hypothetical protein
MDATINQCCTMSSFVKEFVKQHVLDQLVRRTIIPNNYDDDHAHDVGDIHDIHDRNTHNSYSNQGFRWQLCHASLWAFAAIGRLF